MIVKRVPIVAAIAILTVTLVGSCEDLGDELAPVSPGSPVSFSGQIQPIFTANCSNRGCHPGNSAPFQLDIGQSYANLVNIPATNGPCAGQLRVNPGSPESSVLYLRLQGTTCGTRMPQGFAPLSSGEQDLIRDWISQGAMNN